MRKQREHWGTKLGLVLATAGSAVGLGSLWQFPYVVGMNGGGAFVLLYLIFSALIGIPIFLGEVLLGRRAQRGPVGTYEDLSQHSANWRMMGWMNVGSSLLILSFYSVVAGWALNYALLSLRGFGGATDPQHVGAIFNTLACSGDIQLLWHGIFIAMNVGVVLGGVRQGIEHWSRILMPTLFIILLLLLGYSATLSGFGEAARFLFLPDLSKLTAQGILSALGLSFFTLSVGLGILVTYGSYMRATDDIPKMAVTVAGMTVSISLIAAMVIFPIIFSFGFAPQEGPGLLFKTLPIIFTQVPGSILLSTIFFLLVVFTALTSSISLMEAIVANSIEIYDWSRRKAVLSCALTAFVIGIPFALSGSETLFCNWSAIYGSSFFDTVTFLAANWLLPLGALASTLFVGWRLDREMIRNEFLKGTKWTFLYHPWRFSLRWVAPIGIILVMLEQANLINVTELWRS